MRVGCVVLLACVCMLLVPCGAGAENLKDMLLGAIPEGGIPASCKKKVVVTAPHPQRQAVVVYTSGQREQIKFVLQKITNAGAFMRRSMRYVKPPKLISQGLGYGEASWHICGLWSGGGGGNRMSKQTVQVGWKDYVLLTAVVTCYKVT